MDECVIEINDSVITIESEADGEDGEVREVSSDDVTEVIEIKEDEKKVQEGNKDVLVFEVNFRNADDYNKLQCRLLKALSRTFTEEGLVFQTSATKPSIGAYKKAPTALPDSDLFLVDTAPAVKLNASQVPSYKRCHTDVLDEDTPNRKKLKADAVNKCLRPKVQSSCFNCGEAGHGLRECTKPRNQNRIQKARKKAVRVQRYHVDTEQRFAHIRPGKISTKTRHAMGYGRNELPFMFYRMRVLGYPPAWLEEAKVQGSGIALFNADGTEVQKPDVEDGEEDSFKFDINKIIEFPGFNMVPDSKFFDDYQHHNVPPLLKEQLKDNFIKSLGDNVIKGYKRKKLLDLPTAHDADSPTLENSTNCVPHDMDMDDAEDAPQTLQPPLPLEPAKSDVPAPPLSAEEVETPRSSSPTLDDLKAQQDQLLQQLETNTTLNTTTDTSMAEPEASPVKVSTPFKGPSIEGTPILKFSVYDKLPVGDNFKAGVSDVINFENLPDSTGKYEQMKGVLKNIRQRMEQLQNADD
ncbi:CG4622 [Drosophila busckii]|uniref:CG4622 n=1 Tax=Drosophila busckii TaxID=30019 RepID=A0A0M5J709_DROBS|nr:zinc finger CCHC domain-containing protein 8 homolog [Drosophila busckii]ALC41036.1 CG4622 [Drosophila busckii]